MPQQSSEQVSRPYIGGQAVIEGVMMRSPKSLTIVCRRRSGELILRERPMPVATSGPRTWPLIRGVASLVESLRMGYRALQWSVDLLEQDLLAEERGEKPAPAPASLLKKGTNMLSALGIGIIAFATHDGSDGPLPAEPGEKKKPAWMTVVPILFAITLFVALPQAGAEGINKLFNLGLEVTSPGFQVITGMTKLLIVVGYMLLQRQIDLIYRMFQYHGAEHKAISTYEAREELRVENARSKTTMHPRCGTTFLVMVALVSIVVFTLLGSFLPRIPGGRLAESVGFFFMKLPFLPLITAITFEIQRFFAKYCTVGPLRALLWPGFLVQKITTAEPDDAQLEVALGSLVAALGVEQAKVPAAAPVMKSESESPPDRTFPDYEKLLADPTYT
jgi:uncharacterized protein YqhQ